MRKNSQRSQVQHTVVFDFKSSSERSLSQTSLQKVGETI